MPIVVYTPDDLERSGKRAKRPTFEALRYHTGEQNGGIGFSWSLLTAAGPFTIPLQYKNHVEANLIVEGEMNVTEVDTQKSWTLRAGDSYTVVHGERHTAEVAEGKHVKVELRNGIKRDALLVMVPRSVHSPRRPCPSSTHRSRATKSTTPTEPTRHRGSRCASTPRRRRRGSQQGTCSAWRARCSLCICWARSSGPG